MPHVIVEWTAGVSGLVERERLMRRIAMAMDEVGCFKTDDIKVRCREALWSFMGVEAQDHFYVAAEIQVLDNKTDEQLQRMGNSVLKVLQEEFPARRCKSSITVRFTLMNPSLYFRAVNS